MGFTRLPFLLIFVLLYRLRLSSFLFTYQQEACLMMGLSERKSLFFLFMLPSFLRTGFESRFQVFQFLLF